jgi:hypothetical protein
MHVARSIDGRKIEEGKGGEMGKGMKAERNNILCMFECGRLG